ncbi:MAG: hypothetical protein ACE5JI_05040 [Acidobacteriota bacterium]
MNKPLLGTVMVGVAASLTAGASPAGRSQDPIPGFSPPQAAVQRQIEEKLSAELDPSVVARHFRYLTEEPHPAGSDRNLSATRLEMS